METREPIVIFFRVYDNELCKYMNGSFSDEAKCNRQREAILKSGKYSDDRFTVTRFGRDGLPIDDFDFFEEFTIEPL